MKVTYPNSINLICNHFIGAEEEGKSSGVDFEDWWVLEHAKQVRTTILYNR